MYNMYSYIYLFIYLFRTGQFDDTTILGDVATVKAVCFDVREIVESDISESNLVVVYITPFFDICCVSDLVLLVRFEFANGFSLSVVDMDGAVLVRRKLGTCRRTTKHGHVQVYPWDTIV